MTTNAWSGSAAAEHYSTELRGAVNALLGLTDLLLDTPLDTTQREYVDVLRSTADRLLALGGDPASDAGPRARPHSFVHIDAREVVLQVADLAQALAFSPRLTVRTEFGAGVDDPLLGDRPYAEQALLSLVKACTSTLLTDTLVVRADRPEPEELRLTVRASSSADEPRLAGELRARLTSTGRHVDSLQVVEQRDGFAMSFCIPVKETDASVSEETSPGTLRRVLLVEDAADNQFIVRAFLRNQEYDLDIVPTGEAAVDLVRRGGYAIVLMDLELPGISGMEATGLIREWETVHHRRPVPIVALTARSGAADVAKCLSHGFSGFLAKPVSKAGLLSALRSYCLPPQ